VVADPRAYHADEPISRATGAARPARPEPLGAGVPDPPPETAPPLNRRQRRVLKRLRQKDWVK